MHNRFVTHFSTIVAFHLLMLFGWSLTHLDSVTKSLPYMGPVAAMKLEMTQDILRPKPKQPKVVNPARKQPAKAEPVAIPEPRTQTSEAIAPMVSNQADVKSHYHAELRAKIDDNKFYPPMSRRLGQQGVVVVAFTLLEDGKIINIRIDKPSNFERLNESALEAVRKVGKFRPIPRELKQSKLDIVIPVKFITI